MDTNSIVLFCLFLTIKQCCLIVFHGFCEVTLGSLQCRHFLWARNSLAKVPCWNFSKRGGNGASQRERGGGREREEKPPTRKHCENEKHPLIRPSWLLFRKWVADTKQPNSCSSPKTRTVLRKTKLCFYLDQVTMQFSTADEASV